MRNRLTALSFFFLLAASSAYAQTKAVTETDSTRRVLLKYHVLKTDRSVKEGPYAEYLPYNNSLLTDGFYKNNLRDSVWKQYQFGKVIEEGYYKDGKKVGVWKAYNNRGELTLRYDFTNNKLLYYTPRVVDTSKNFRVIKGTDTVKQRLDNAPIYLDGEQMIYRTIVTTTRYPKGAREENISGKVMIAFTIAPDGKASNFHVVQGVGGGCSEEALHVIENINGDWIPGTFNGQPVAVEYTIPLSFTLTTN